MQKSIGRYFYEARLALALTLEEVASHTGLIDVHELERLESDTYRPPLDTLYALVNAYNLDPDEFIEMIYALAIEPVAEKLKTAK